MVKVLLIAKTKHMQMLRLTIFLHETAEEINKRNERYEINK